MTPLIRIFKVEIESSQCPVVHDGYFMSGQLFWLLRHSFDLFGPRWQLNLFGHEVFNLAVHGNWFVEDWLELKQVFQVVLNLVELHFLDAAVVVHVEQLLVALLDVLLVFGGRDVGVEQVEVWVLRRMVEFGFDFGFMKLFL